MARLPILMYHNFTNNKTEVSSLTVLNSDFEEQLRYLVAKKYTFYHFKELTNLSTIAKRSVVLTFDDVTTNQLEIALPLLEKYAVKASFFIPFSFVGKKDVWNDGNESIMTTTQLHSLNSELIELGHHSFYHKKYKSLSEEEINADFKKSFEFIKDNNLTVSNALAYPYGNYPKDKEKKQIFIKCLKNNSIQFGLKIGNRPNQFPFKNPYEIKRIDCKGTNSFWQFKLKLKVGKLKLF